MVKTAVIVLAGTETHADLGRLTNALQTVRESKQAGDDVELIFDGAGTQWVPELESEDHTAHALYESVKDVASACEYCAGAFHVEGGVESSAADVVAEFDGHPSVRDLVADGYEVVTF